MTCSECKALSAELGKPPDCKACGKVVLLSSNYEVYTIIDLYSSIILHGSEGFNVDGIKYALELENVPKHKHKDYTHKITMYLNTYISALRKKHENITKVR